MSETTFRARISREWRRCNAKVIPYVPGQYGDNGTPDVVVVWNGFTFFCEFKGLKTALTPLQKNVIMEINAKQGIAFVYREPGRVEDISGNLLFTAHKGVEALKWIERVYG